MKNYLLGISAAAIVALAAGCGGDTGGDASGMNHSPTPTSTATDQAEHNDQDIAFAQGMIPHHQQAVDMATMAAEKATNTQVKDLATRVRGAQDPEIQQLTEMLEQWGAPTEPTTPSSESSMPGMDHGGTAGHGMMAEEDMQQLEQATGADFDRLWVRMMIEHHQGAVAMANTELEQGADADAKALAKTIAETQEAEITEMQAMSL